MDQVVLPGYIDEMLELLQREQKMEKFHFTSEAKQVIVQQIIYVLNGILENMQSLCDSTQTDKATLDTFYFAFCLHFQKATCGDKKNKNLSQTNLNSNSTIQDPLLQYIECMLRKRLLVYYKDILKTQAPENKLFSTMKSFFSGDKQQKQS